MKIAVCFFAEIRDGYMCSPNIKKYFSGNDENTIIDYYFHTWDHTYLKSHNNYDFTLDSGLNNGTEFIKKENDEWKKLDLKKLKYFINTYDIKSYKIDNENKYISKTKFLGNPQWNSLYECISLMDGDYDLIVASRPDIIFSESNNFFSDYLTNKIEIENDAIIGYEEFLFFSKLKNMKELIEKKITSKTEINFSNATFKVYDGKQICIRKNKFPTILRPESIHLNVLMDFDEIERINKTLYN